MLRADSKGLSLIETVIFCSLLSLFSVVAFLSLPGRSNRASLALQEASQEGGIALRKLTNELANSSTASVRTLDPQTGLVFLTAVPDGGIEFQYSSKGEIEWSGWVAYIEQDGALVRHSFPFSQVSYLNTTEAPRFGSYRYSGGQPMVRSLASLQFKEDAPGLWQIYLTVSVESSKMELRTATQVRNP